LVFLGQLGARCSELKQILHGYLNGILVGLTSCVVIPTTDSTILVETIGTASSFLFLLWQVFLAWPILPQFEHVNYCLAII